MKKAKFGLTQQKQSLSLFKTERSSEIQSDLKIESITTKKVTKEVFWGQHMDSQKSFDERKTSNQHLFKRHYIYRYWFWWTLHFCPAETKTKLEQKINAEKSAIASKLKSVETSDSMTLIRS
jgi:hypothetical protein